MGIFTAFRLRMERRRWQLRAARKSADLNPFILRKEALKKSSILAFLTIRNEGPRLPFFLDYYRRLGVGHFLFVDNGSDDGGGAFLAEQPDVSIWFTEASYRESRFGTDWMNWLKFRYGHGKWTLTLDPDEFLVYPFCDTRPLPALCDWLDQTAVRSFGTLLLDMYPKGEPSELLYRSGQDPFELTPWFDPGNYMMQVNPRYGNLWIQGGPRARVYFNETPEMAPSLNKIPLVKWDRRYAYVTSTHMILPRGLNRVYDRAGGEKASGCLLHAKFLDSLAGKAAEEVLRRQHFAGGREYEAYHVSPHRENGLWCEWSERFTGWRQLEELGLISAGNWA